MMKIKVIQKVSYPKVIGTFECDLVNLMIYIISLKYSGIYKWKGLCLGSKNAEGIEIATVLNVQILSNATKKIWILFQNAQAVFTIDHLSELHQLQ